jgi:hypothetical protein
MGRNRSAAQSKEPLLKTFASTIWAQIAAFLIGTGLLSGSGFLLLDGPKAELDLADKIAQYHSWHPEVTRATQMLGSYNRFDLSFEPKNAFLLDIVDHLSQSKESGTLPASYVNETSRAVQEMISELEEQKGTLRGFNLTGDQKELQGALINELDLREQSCRELISAINHWATETLTDRNLHFDAIISLTQRSLAANRELKTRDLQEIDNAKTVLSAENLREQQNLKGQVWLFERRWIIELAGVSLGAVLVVTSGIIWLWPHLVRKKGPDKRKRSKPKSRGRSSA